MRPLGAHLANATWGTDPITSHTRADFDWRALDTLPQKVTNSILISSKFPKADLPANPSSSFQVCLWNQSRLGSPFINWKVPSLSCCCCSSVMSHSSWPHGLQHARLPCLSPTPEVCPSSRLLHQSAIWSSHPLTPSSSALSLSQHRGWFQWIGSSHQVTKILALQHRSFQRVFRVDFP